MTAGQTVNLVGSIAALSGSAGFVLVYSIFAPWWRSHVGRLLVVKAVAISLFMAISVLSYAIDPGTDRHLSPLLLARGVLAAGYGVLMVYQAWIVSSAQLKGSRGAGDV